jgi:serine/threonine protein kinase/tetratricopeptide (TPR) repeat protein/TolB-like protein
MAAGWTRTKELFSLALEREPEARSAYLREACDGDEALRAEVESLLQSHYREDTFLEGSGPALLDADPTSDVIGRRVGDYRIVSEAGRGGTSIVYLAERADQHYEKRVAIKMLRSGEDSAEILQRFRMERQTLARLDHPNIITLLDGGSTEEGLPYLVMDFVEGVPVDRYCEERRLSLTDRLKIFRTVCDTVEYAHCNGVIHRDLKPSNILVTCDGAPRLLDFGIAKLRDPKRFSLSTLATLSGMHAMTPEYASPEQLRGQPVTAATDIYSLGVLLYVLLCGRHPYPTAGRSLLELERMVCEVAPVRPSVAATCPEQIPSAPGESPQLSVPEGVAALRDEQSKSLRRALRGDLDAIALKALSKEPERRYLSAGAFSDDVSRHLGGKPVTARRTTFLYRTTKFVARHRESMVVILIAVAALGLIAAWEVRRSRVVLPVPAATGTHLSTRPTVAVLGFKNLSGRDDTAWLDTALAEMLTTELAAGGQVRLIPGETIARVRIELSLPDVATLSAETLKAVQRDLGSDYVVSGAFLDLGAPSARRIRLDLHLQNAVSGETLTSLSEEGVEQQLFALVSRTGERLRSVLGLSAMLPGDATRAHEAMPSNTEAARLYAEGLAKLRAFDALAARDLLSRSVIADPAFPLAHAALAKAWIALGYDGNARDEAKAALDRAASLSREDQLLVEGGYYEAAKDWEKSLDAYGTLFNFFPDNPDYGLALANAETAAGRGKEALATLQKLRRLPREAEIDPRVDLAEANAASVLSDNALQVKAGDTAARKGILTGARLLVAAARVMQCRALANMGDAAGSNRACEEARSIYAATGDGAGTARMLHAMAELPLDQGDLDRAQSLFEEALAITRRIGDRRGMARELGNLGNVFEERGQFDQAGQFYRDSLIAFREIGNRNGTGSEEGSLGEVFRAQGRLPEALAQYQKSIAIAREIGNTELEGNDLQDMGDLSFDLGDLGAAAHQYDQALNIYRRLGEKNYEAEVLVALGRIRAERGDAHATLALYQQALASQTQLGMKGDLAQTQLALAELTCEANQGPEAARLARIALQEFQLEHREGDQMRGQAVLARALQQQGELGAARAAIEASRTLAGHGSLDDSLTLRLADARVRIAEGKVADAERGARKLLTEATEHGLFRQRLEASLTIAEAQIAGPDAASAQPRLAELETEARARGFERIALKAAALAARSAPVSSSGT